MLTREGLHEGSSDLAEDPRDDEGQGEEAAIGDASGAAADAAGDRAARLASAGRATRGEARGCPHHFVVDFLLFFFESTGKKPQLRTGNPRARKRRAEARLLSLPLVNDGNNFLRNSPPFFFIFE